MFLGRLRATQPSMPLAIVRVLLGVLFLMTGLMKLFVPDLRAAFSGQLTAAAIPAHSLNSKEGRRQIGTRRFAQERRS